MRNVFENTKYFEDESAFAFNVLSLTMVAQTGIRLAEDLEEENMKQIVAIRKNTNHICNCGLRLKSLWLYYTHKQSLLRESSNVWFVIHRVTTTYFVSSYFVLLLHFFSMS